MGNGQSQDRGGAATYGKLKMNLYIHPRDNHAIDHYIAHEKFVTQCHSSELLYMHI